MRIGRYQIKFGKYFWLQTSCPVRARKFLMIHEGRWFTIFKEARPTDAWTEEQEFPLGTRMIHEGRRYYYVKFDK